MGLLQKKVLLLLFLLLVFNEPFYGISAVTGLKFYSVAQALLEATFLAFLLHFWAFLLDSTVSSGSGEFGVKFSGAKTCLVFSIWLCVSASVICVKLNDGETFSLARVERLASWSLTALVIIYALMLAVLLQRALKFLR